VRFVSVTKPGIIFGNIITALGGYFLGSQGHFNLKLLVGTLVGMSLIIASGCVFNNYIDRDIDRLMERTKDRVLVKGLISIKVAILYAVVLGLLGLLALCLTTNLLTVSVALSGLFIYVIAYSLYWKRKSLLGTAIGGISGAVPPVVGYCAVTNHFDIGAWTLFVMLFLWQMPHFYAISIYRLSDYSAAAIPILPLKKSMHYTKVTMLIFIILFAIVALLPSLLGYTGYIYFVITLLLGLLWIGVGIRGLTTTQDKPWARKMFIISIIIIMALSFLMAIKY